MKKNKGKRILSLALVILLALGAVAGYFVMAYQASPQILDRTEGGAPDSGEENNDIAGGAGDIPTQAVLSQSVTMFTAEESKQINFSILKLSSLDSGVEMEIKNGSRLDDMGVGDIFFLEGNESTPFGMSYIGKIGAVMQGASSSTYVLETPMMDEVFDVLRFSEEGVLSPENLVAVECMPGVMLMGQAEAQASGTAYVAGALSGSTVMPLATVKDTTELMFNVEIDLAKLLGLTEKEGTDQKKVDSVDATSTDVYVTNTGKRYHQERCSYLHSSKKKMSLENALKQDYTPCAKCKPVLLQGDTFKPELSLKGHFGMKELTYSATCNWDILNGKGLEDLYFDVNGVFSTGLKLEGGLNWQISGKTTKYKLSKSIMFEGLKERLIPLAAVHFSVDMVPKSVVGIGNTANAQIRSLTSAMPLSVVGIVYVDGHGKLSTGFSAYFNYEKSFTYNKTIVRGGKFAYDSSYDPGKNEIDYGVEFELTADADIHVGGGLDLYIFNLKVAQLDVVQIGATAAGEAKLQYTNGVAQQEDNVFEWDAHVRGYVKLLQLNLALKAKLEILPFLDLSFDADYDFCLWDHTLFEYGKPSDTRFDASTMSYNHITAKDNSASYYKDPSGCLVIEKDDRRTVLWEEPFFTICGIDATYIYVLEDNDSGNHNIRRIAKNGKTSKIVAEDVEHFLTIDEKNMYYVPGFDESTIRRLNRGSGKVDTLANFSDDVVYMTRQGENFYVATGSSSFFGFYGDYMLIDKEGNTIENYGSNPSVEEMEKREFNDYRVAIKISSSGYLRNTAEAVYWVGADGSNQQIYPVTGWNYFQGGIITMEHAGSGYRIVLYRAADGSKVTLGTSAHSYALFTAAQDNQGRWYYLDQTSSEVILYTVSPDLSQQRIMQRSPKSDFPVDLSNCNAVLVDGKLYFYSIVNEKTCQVLYRYNIH